MARDPNDKASVMSVQDVLLFSLAPVGGAPVTTFADPEWRGDDGDDGQEQRLRPLIDIDVQIRRLDAWIMAGGDYGWLGAYQARRAGFELRSVRAQIEHETADNGGVLADYARLTVQSRLDRLERCLQAARWGVGFG